MPRKDGTGPVGKGPKTGRGLGNCDDNSTRSNNGNGQRLRDGSGKGKGRRK